MELKNMDNRLPKIFLLSLLLVLAGCSDSSDSVNEVDVITSDAYQNTSDTTATDNFDYEIIDQEQGDSMNDDVIDNEVAAEQLVIDGNKCIGCGKCARTASANFAMQSGVATVVSQSNIEDSDVQKAINNCPVGAISIKG